MDGDELPVADRDFDSLTDRELARLVLIGIEQFDCAIQSAIDENSERFRSFNGGARSGRLADFELGRDRAQSHWDGAQRAVAAARDIQRELAGLLQIPKCQCLGDAAWRTALTMALYREAEELSRLLQAKPTPGGVSFFELNRWHEVVGKLIAPLNEIVTSRAPAPDGHPLKVGPRRRNTNAQILMQGRLLAHHGYQDGRYVKNQSPIDPKAMRGSGAEVVSTGIVSTFFKTHFGSYDDYCRTCKSPRLPSKLAQLAGEWLTASGISVEEFTGS